MSEVKLKFKKDNNKVIYLQLSFRGNLCEENQWNLYKSYCQKSNGKHKEINILEKAIMGKDPHIR